MLLANRENFIRRKKKTKSVQILTVEQLEENIFRYLKNKKKNY
jgi:hypothetical protein